MLKGKKVAVYVTGGIAVYKACDLVRKLIKQGAHVKVAMTTSATKFVTPLTFQILSKNDVHIDTFDEDKSDQVSHIHLADWSELAIVAPATANVIAKMAHGIADDFVTTALLATTAPVVVVPAMNTHMLENPATQRNLETLSGDGRFVIEPDTGFLAEGYEGKGRFPESDKILESLYGILTKSDGKNFLSGKKVLVTAGGTKERIDPVRFITNDSSGKMGYSLAAAARDLGAEVLLVTASDLPVPFQIESVHVNSAAEMHQAVLGEFHTSDVVIMAAAVSDYTPSQIEKEKIKKDEDTLSVTFQKTKDILADLGQKKTDQFLIGFAAETKDLEKYAQGKLEKKNADMIVANDVTKPHAGFNKDTNEVTIFMKHEEPVHLPVKSKKEVAEDILSIAIRKMKK